jgi:hypothetical protein
MVVKNSFWYHLIYGSFLRGSHIIILGLFSIFSFGQMIPKFNRGISDTLIISDRIPVIVSVSAGQSDPSLIALKSPDLNSYLISRLNDSTFVINNRGVQSETRLKLYYKNIPVDVIPAVYRALDVPKIFIKDFKELPLKSTLGNVSSFVCDIDEVYKMRFGVSLHAFDIQILYPGGRKEYLQNFSTNIITANFSKIKSLPPDSVVIFKNLKLRTIYNSIVDIPGDSSKFLVKE